VAHLEQVGQVVAKTVHYSIAQGLWVGLDPVAQCAGAATEHRWSTRVGTHPADGTHSRPLVAAIAAAGACSSGSCQVANCRMHAYAPKLREGLALIYVHAIGLGQLRHLF
jgi:hypothetical protein